MLMYPWLGIPDGPASNAGGIVSASIEKALEDVGSSSISKDVGSSERDFWDNLQDDSIYNVSGSTKDNADFGTYSDGTSGGADFGTPSYVGTYYNGENPNHYMGTYYDATGNDAAVGAYYADNNQRSAAGLGGIASLILGGPSSFFQYGLGGLADAVTEGASILPEWAKKLGLGDSKYGSIGQELADLLGLKDNKLVEPYGGRPGSLGPGPTNMLGQVQRSGVGNLTVDKYGNLKGQISPVERMLMGAMGPSVGIIDPFSESTRWGGSSGGGYDDNTSTNAGPEGNGGVAVDGTGYTYLGSGGGGYSSSDTTNSAASSQSSEDSFGGMHTTSQSYSGGSGGSSSSSSTSTSSSNNTNSRTGSGSYSGGDGW
tara:strand:+ start:2370 stop:3482 length:1113 start_codon:yes stop_codon:yes gene_type:complete